MTVLEWLYGSGDDAISPELSHVVGLCGAVAGCERLERAVWVRVPLVLFEAANGAVRAVRGQKKTPPERG